MVVVMYVGLTAFQFPSLLAAVTGSLYGAAAKGLEVPYDTF